MQFYGSVVIAILFFASAIGTDATGRELRNTTPQPNILINVTHDMAETYPKKLNTLAASWKRYAKDNGVVEPDRPVGYAKAPKPGSY